MNDIQYDLYRLAGKTGRITFIKTFFHQRSFRFMVYFRWCQNKDNICRYYLGRLLGFFLHRKMSVEMPYTVKAGKGLLMIHPYSITFNSQAEVGENFTIMKGATIGNIKSGLKQGSPVIGNNVYVGLNSTIVGGVRIGDDVMIAANTFVNFDVPNGALVIGSPGVIHIKEKASEPYINNSICQILNL